MGHLLVWSLGALLPLICTLAPAPYSLQPGFSLPHTMTVFSFLAPVPISFLVTDVGSPWPRILPCSCLLPSPCLGRSSSPRPMARAVRSVNRPFRHHLLPSSWEQCLPRFSAAGVQSACWHSPKPLHIALPINPWPELSVEIKVSLGHAIYTLGRKHSTVCCLPV